MRGIILPRMDPTVAFILFGENLNPSAPTAMVWVGTAESVVVASLTSGQLPSTVSVGCP